MPFYSVMYVPRGQALTRKDYMGQSKFGVSGPWYETLEAAKARRDDLIKGGQAITVQIAELVEESVAEPIVEMPKFRPVVKIRRS